MEQRRLISSQRVTVVLRSKNCAGVLLQTLMALYSQSCQGFELCIIDSGSTDESVSVAKLFPCVLRHVPEMDYFPGEVLNEAIRTIGSEIIVFLNSDGVMLTPRVLEALLEPFEDVAVQAAFGRQIPRPDAETYVRADLAKNFPASGSPPDWQPFALPVAAMRRSIWQKRPFYTDAWGSEDTEWGEWARREGIKICYVPAACVMHSHNYTFRQLYGRHYIEGEADAFIYGFQPSLSKMLVRYAKSLGVGVCLQVKMGDWLGILKVPWVRLVQRWAYYQGLRLGSRRRQRCDPDKSIGQREVLRRYER